MDFNNVSINFLGIKRLGLFDGYQIIERHNLKTILRCLSKSFIFYLIALTLIHIIISISNFIGYELIQQDVNYAFISMYGFLTERLSLETNNLQYEQ